MTTFPEIQEALPELARRLNALEKEIEDAGHTEWLAEIQFFHATAAEHYQKHGYKIPELGPDDPRPRSGGGK